MTNPGNTIITLATSTTSTQVAVSTSILDFKIRKVLNLGVDYFEGTFKSPMSPTPTVGNMLVVSIEVRGVRKTEYIGEVYDVTYENRNTRIKARTYSYKLAIANDSFAGATNPGDMMDKAVAKAGMSIIKNASWSQNYSASPMYDAQCALIAIKRATEFPVADNSYPTAFYPSPGEIDSITVDGSGSGTPDSGVTLTYRNGLIASPNFTTRSDSVVDYVVVQGLENGISGTVGSGTGRSEVLYRQEYIMNADCTQVAEALFSKLSVNRVKVSADVRFYCLFPTDVNAIDTPINKLYTIVDETQRNSSGVPMTQQAALSEYTLKYPSLIASCVFSSPFIDYNDFVPEIDTRVSQLERTPSGGVSKVFIAPSTTVRYHTYAVDNYPTGATQVTYPTYSKIPLTSDGVNLANLVAIATVRGQYTAKVTLSKNVININARVRRYSANRTLMEESSNILVTSTTRVEFTVTMTDIALGDYLEVWATPVSAGTDWVFGRDFKIMYDYKAI